MIISTKEASVISDLPQGEIIQSGVSAEGMAHIMAVLTHLYKDPQMAVIREIYSNALDSHIASGQKRPVEVTLPTRFEPTFVVQDFGVGMSRETIREKYAQYGESTKRDSNDQIGAFGLGAKSPLAITPQFTFESIKDGAKHTAVYALNDEGNPQVNIINSEPTDEESGVTVSIPIDDVYNFNEKARKFFYYSDPEIVLVDGQKPVTFHDETELLDTDVEDVTIRSNTSTSYYRRASYIVMGNVPYELSYSEMEESLRRQGVNAGAKLLDSGKYFSVDIGSVDLTPSREGLRFTPKTKALVDKAMAAYVTTLKEQAQAAIDKIEDRWKVGAEIELWKNRIGTTLQWRGETYPKHVDTPDGVDYFDLLSRYDDGDASYSIESKIMPNRIYTFVSGVDFGDTKKYARYFGPYLKKVGSGHEYFAFFPDTSLITDKWITENKINTWITIEDLIAKAKEQMKADRAAKKTSSKGTTQKLTYPVLQISSGTVAWQPYDTIAANTPFLAASDFRPDTSARRAITYQYGNGWESRNYGSGYAQRLATALASTTDATEVILLGGSRTELALKNRVPTAYKLTTDIESKRKKMQSLITKDIAKAFAMRNDSGIHALEAMSDYLDEDSPKIKDKALTKALNFEEDETFTKVVSYNAGARFLSFAELDDLEIQVKDDPNRISIGTKYPLLREFNRYNMSKDRAHHLVHYLNSVRNLSNSK